MRYSKFLSRAIQNFWACIVHVILYIDEMFQFVLHILLKWKRDERQTRNGEKDQFVHDC